MDATDPLYVAVAAFNDAACILASGSSPLRDRLKVALGETALVDLAPDSELGQRVDALRASLGDRGLAALDDHELGTVATEIVGIALDAAASLAVAEAMAQESRS